MESLGRKLSHTPLLQRKPDRKASDRENQGHPPERNQYHKIPQYGILRYVFDIEVHVIKDSRSVEENEAPDNQLPRDVEIAASRCHAIVNTGMPQLKSLIIACLNSTHRFVKKMTKGLFFYQFSDWLKFNLSDTFNTDLNVCHCNKPHWAHDYHNKNITLTTISASSLVALDEMDYMNKKGSE